MDTPQKVASTMKKHSMLSTGDTVLVGLSGGPDSTCLLLVLKELAERLKLSLCAAYVEHGLRPGETRAEMDFTSSLCKGIEVPFTVKQVDLSTAGGNVQEAARALRYGALGEAADEFNAGRIAVGHTLDDQAETLLMRLMRGAGPKGLGGIAPVRGSIIRPLIETPRSEVEAYLAARGITAMRDSSNLKLDYTRNRLRETIMPLLREHFNPSVTETIARAADILREEDQYLETTVTKTLMRLITRKGDGFIELFLVPMQSLHRVILRRALRRALEATDGLRGIRLVHIDDIVGLIKDGEAGQSVTLPRRIRAIRKYSTLLITTEAQEALETCSLSPGETVNIDNEGLSIEASEFKNQAGAPGATGDPMRAVLDAGKLEFPLTVRARRDGDYFYPLGFGKRKKLQDFLVDAKVPREERGRVPVVTSGGQVIWVAGMRADERFRPTGETSATIELTLRRGRK